MSQPPAVPSRPGTPKYYQSPPRRGDSWKPNRPGELVRDGQPHGAGLGSQGPDQGFAYSVARRIAAELHLQPGEHTDDVIAGCVPVALKRASQFMRGPSVHDVRIAYELFGFLDPSPSAALVNARKPLFDHVSHAHHKGGRQAIADLVPAALLKQPVGAIQDAVADWRQDALLR